MRFCFLTLFLFLRAFSASAQDLSATGIDLPAPYREALGKTFEVMGPNCFGTVLKLSGFQSTFRGVDVGEFQAFVKLACRQVESPEPGDIGVFEAPGFAFLHAYLYLSPDLGLDKPGVDYLGKTPISIKPLSSILYRNIASPECRRYSKDVGECSNLHYYVRCSGLPEESSPWLRDHDRKVGALESLMGKALEMTSFGPEQGSIVQGMEQRLAELRADLTRMPPNELSADRQSYVRGRLQSLEKQLTYFQIKVRPI